MLHDKLRDSQHLLIDNYRGSVFVSSALLFWGLLFAILYIISRINYPLFHTIADTFTVFIASGIFVVMWYSRRHIDNNYLLYSAIALLFFAFLDFLHMLGNKNMGVFPQYGNLGPALYIASRYVLSISLVIAPLFINRKLRVVPVFFAYSLVTLFILLSIFYWKNFPVCYVEGVGLTTFKVASDYAICLILMGALALLLFNRQSFDARVLRLLSVSIILSIATGMSFTLYTDPFGLMNAIGHFFQILSFYMIYLAFIETGLTKPQDIVFKRLNESEERLRLANKATNDVVWDWDVINDTERWNEAGTVVFGWTEIVERPVTAAWWVERVHPDDRQRVEAGVFAVVDDPARSHWQDEYLFLKADGTYAEVMDRGYVLRNEQGKAIRMIGAMIDFTSRKQAEEKLRESEERFRTFFDLPGAGFAITAADGKWIHFNNKFAEMLGYSREEFEQKTWMELNPYEDFIKEKELFMEVIDGARSSTNLEKRYISKDGSLIDVIVATEVVRNNDGSVAYFASIILDITSRKQAEEALQANEARLRAVFDSVQDFIFIKDANRRYLVINNFFQKRFQVDPSVFLGHTDAEIPIFENKDMTGAIVHNTDAMVLRGETAHFDLMHRVCGTLLTLDILKTPIRDRQGNVTGICGVSRDITDRRKAEEEKRGLEERLNRAEKMESLGTLAGGVAHDLNNVLGIVVGYAEMLMDELDEANPMRNDLEKILEGGNRSAAIVQDLLTLARRGVQTKNTVNLNATIMDCQKLPEFEKVFSYNPQIKLQTDLESDLLNIIGSPVHLAKSIINLAANAVEAMPNGGVLKIATANQYLDVPIQGYDNIREGDYVVLTVSDTGEGIPERDIKRIFEPFYTKKIMGRSGTGLGLAVVWGTIKDHNGYINVESTEGKGTTFTLYFPVTREEIASDQVSVSMSEYMGRGETILVVDDINRQRELASRMLTKLNYSVSNVASGEDAIEYIKTHEVDLLVLDMIMDLGIDGLETYEKILQINPLQRAVIVSGFSESDRVREAQKIGAGAYVPKPYILEHLGMAVRKELDRK
jgi:PAS domain S-box-containing protein